MIMGRFLSRREIVKELGYTVWDDDSKEWALAYNGANIVGFGAFYEKKKGVKVITSVYVLPKYRQKGIGKKILEKIEFKQKQLEWSGTLQATCTELGAHLHKSLGFEKVGERGRYTIMEKQVK